jgi:hypothetical protein
MKEGRKKRKEGRRKGEKKGWREGGYWNKPKQGGKEALQ